MTNIATLSSLALTPPWNYQVTGPKGDLAKAFEQFFVRPLPEDLDRRPIGNLADLSDVHGNVAHAAGLQTILGDLMGHIAKRGGDFERFERLIVAMRLIVYGAHLITTAHVLHLRGDRFSGAAALAQVRIAIELVARGGWVALASASSMSGSRTFSRRSVKPNTSSDYRVRPWGRTARTMGSPK